MALTKEEIRSAYPLPSYNYRVEIGGEIMSFSEVSGLTIKIDTTTYKESPNVGGSPGPTVMHMPAQGTPATITLKRGIVRGDAMLKLYAWINSVVVNQVEKKDVFVRLCDEKGDAVLSWKAINAFPTQVDAPSFSAGGNDAAIESVTLMADGISLEAA